MDHFELKFAPIAALLTIFATMFLLTCDSDSGSTPSDHFPQIADLSFFKKGSYVAYNSPNRSTKPDSISLDFIFSNIEISSINASAALIGESTTWAPDTLFAIDSRNARAVWIPKNKPDLFSFCGRHTGFCTLSTPDTTVTSDTFTLIGTKAVDLIAPIPVDTLFADDTFFIEYRINSDKISNIQIFLYSDSLDDWVEIAGKAVRKEDNPPIRVFSSDFIPDHFSDLFHAGQTYSLKFLLRDYDAKDPTASLTTAPVTFTNKQRKQ